MTTLTFTRPSTISAVQFTPLGNYGATAPVRITLTGGAGTGTVTPNGVDWCWVARDVGVGGTTRAVAVPANGTVAFESLTTLDPATILPASINSNASAVTAAATLVAAKVDKGTLVINAQDAPYNADPTGAIDATTAIQAAANAVYALTAVTPGYSQSTVRLYAQGTFKVSNTITINVPCDLSNATFLSTQTTGVVVQVGSATLPLYNTELKLPQVISTAKTVTGWAQVAGTTGVRATNLYGCRVYVPNIKNFETGLWAHAQNINGTSYNAFYFGALNNNKVNLKVSPESTGTGGTSSWVNANTFNYGSFNHQTSEGTQVSGVRHVFIDNATWPINDNEFHRLSLETNNVVEYHVECYGHDNLFDWCRWEDSTPGNIRVLWRGWSYRNVINGGIDSQLISYTTETGAYNFGAATPIVSYPTASIPASLGAGGLIADSTANRLIFSPDGILKQTVATQDDVVTLKMEGVPEGVVTAAPGTTYARTDTTNRVNAAAYPIADGVTATTGWSVNGGALTAGTGYLRNTLVASAGGTSRGITTVNAATFAVTPNVTYSFSVEARTSNPALHLALRVLYYATGGVPLGTTAEGTAVVGPVAFTRLGTLTLAAPPTAAYVYVQVAVDGGPANLLGDTVDARHLIYEVAPAAGSYFAGDTASGNGNTYAWTGTVNASTSTLTVAPTTPISYVKTGSGNTGWKALAPAGAISVPVNGSDPATTQTLVNALRAALVTSGIVV